MSVLTRKRWGPFLTLYRHAARKDRGNQQAQFDKINASLDDLKHHVVHTNDTDLSPYDAVSPTAAYKDFTSVSLTVLKQIGKSIKSVGGNSARNALNVNEHFDTPKPVDRFYTGRKDKAEQLPMVASRWSPRVR